MTRRIPQYSRVVLLVLSILVSECAPTQRAESVIRPSSGSPNQISQEFSDARERMVREQIESRGVRDARVLAAMRKVERHRFVPEALQHWAYADQPLPIGHGQTISQPYIVAFMTESLELKPSDRVLEIGTGSGYQAAILAELCREVYSIEIVEPLSKEASERLEKQAYKNLKLRVGNGYRGWPEAAPFDAIMVTAAPPSIPQALLDQLAVGGRLLVPVGRLFQELVRVRRTPKGMVQEDLLPVRFVPMVGEDEAVKQNPSQPR
jgi:protein-L-isoaspartate(D-aspartate) O-methyltransferase